jgi:hypothetical protein
VRVCVTLADDPSDCDTDGVDVELPVRLPETLLEADDEALLEAEEVCIEGIRCTGSSGHGKEREQCLRAPNTSAPGSFTAVSPGISASAAEAMTKRGRRRAGGSRIYTRLKSTLATKPTRGCAQPVPPARPYSPHSQKTSSCRYSSMSRSQSQMRSAEERVLQRPHSAACCVPSLPRWQLYSDSGSLRPSCRHPCVAPAVCSTDLAGGDRSAARQRAGSARRPAN